MVGMFPSSMEWVQYDDRGSKREASGHIDIRKMGVWGVYHGREVVPVGAARVMEGSAHYN